MLSLCVKIKKIYEVNHLLCKLITFYVFILCNEHQDQEDIRRATGVQPQQEPG
jgi:hypothetical protein